MATTSSFASTVVDNSGSGTVAWTNPGNATGDYSSNQAATRVAQVFGLTGGAQKISHYLWANNFASLSIPAGATINGITLQIGVYSGSTVQVDNAVQLVKSGSIVGSNLATGTTMPVAIANWQVWTYGGSTNLWGTTWTASDITSTFGAIYQTKGLSNGGISTYCLGFKITIDYTAASSANRLLNLRRKAIQNAL